MSLELKDRYHAWVESRKLEEDDGFWITDSEGKPIEGPYSEDFINDILWRQAMEEVK